LAGHKQSGIKTVRKQKQFKGQHDTEEARQNGGHAYPAEVPAKAGSTLFSPVHPPRLPPLPV